MIRFNILKECKNWVNDNIITHNQAQQICEKYGVDYNNPDNNSSGYNTLVFLGYLFIGIALIILIGQNWEEIPRFGRATLLISLTFGINLYASINYINKPQKSIALFFLGSLLYGASIILIAQIYHLGEHMPDGVFWWSFGVLPLAIILKDNYIMMLSLILATIWFFLELIEFDNLELSYLIFALFNIYGLYKYPQNILAFIVSAIILPLSSIAIFIYEFNKDFKFGEFWLISLGFLFLLYAIAIILENNKTYKLQLYGSILSFMLILITAINILVLTYKDMWFDDNSWITIHIIFSKNSILITSFLFITASLIAIYYKKYINLAWSFLFIITTLLQTITVEQINPLVMQFLYNAVFVIFAIGLIIIGINKVIAKYFFLGVSFVLLFAFIRYIDLVGGYIGTSLLFIFLAIVMLGSAKYWRYSFAK